MELVVHLARGEEARDAGHAVLVVGPEPAHRVVDAGEDAHRHLCRVVTHELAVDLHDAAELDLEHMRVQMADVEVDLVLAVDAEAEVHADVEDLAGGDVARHQVAVLRVLLFEEVPGLAVFIRPDAAAFAADRFGHQAQLVLAGDGRRVHLDELAVGVEGALLIDGAGRRARVDHRVGRQPEDQAGAAGRQDDGIGGEGPDRHALHVLGDDAAAGARVVEDGAEELPVLVLVHQVARFLAAHLLVERVQQLLPGGGAREGRAVVLGAPEAPEVQIPLGRAVKHHAHAVEQVDDRGALIAHVLDDGLVGQEVAAVNRVVEVDPGRIALALRIDRGVNAALGADGV